MAPSARPQSPEIIVKEWARPGDILWFALGVAMIAAVAWVEANVPVGNLIEVGNVSAYPKYVDAHQAPLEIPLLVVLGWVMLKFGPS